MFLTTMITINDVFNSSHSIKCLSSALHSTLDGSMINKKNCMFIGSAHDLVKTVTNPGNQ